MADGLFVQNGIDDLDSDSSSDGIGSSNDTISTIELASLFTSRHNRDFAASDAPYFLPFDMEEMNRLNLQHNVFKLALEGRNLIGEATPAILTPTPSQRNRVLDLGSGSGQWIREMAAQYRHVRFIGVDLVPTPDAGFPPPNAHFECYDINTQAHGIRSTSTNLVHCRCICLGIRNYRNLVREAFRALRPGGIFLSIEPEYLYSIAGGASLAEMPATAETFQRLKAYAQSRGLNVEFNSAEIPTILADEGFTGVGSRFLEMPLGTWMPNNGEQMIGQQTLDITVRYMSAIRPALMDASEGGGGLDQLLINAVQEIQTSQGLTIRYRLAYGTKPS